MLLHPGLFPIEPEPGTETDDATDERRALEVAHDPVERQFLAAIAGGDDACAVVYADWLEERGEPARAEFLRAQAVIGRRDLGATARAAASHRLEALAAELDLGWRLAVRRRGIAHCAAFGLRCERTWRSLSPTAHAGVGHCDSCDRRVRCCRTDEQVRHFSRRGTCVVRDDGEPDAREHPEGLPEQLRYLEQLAPAEAPPTVMAPKARPVDLVDYLRELIKNL